MVRTELLYKVTFEVTNGLVDYQKDGVTKNAVLAKIATKEVPTEPTITFEEMKDMLFKAYGNPKMYDEFGWKLSDLMFRRSIDDFGNDLGPIEVKEVIADKDIGLAIYAFVGAKRFQDKIQRYKEEAASVKDEFYGEVGTRYTLELTFDKVVHFNDYSMYFYHDSENRCFKWSTVDAPTREVGKTYKMIGTVKDHREYNGIKQTCINRCKIMAA